MSIEAMKQALEALEVATTPLARDRQTVLKAQIELLLAIEQAEKQEPVAKVILTETLGLPTMQWLDLTRQFDFKGGEFLYTSPPRKEWVILSDDDLIDLPSFDYSEPQYIAEREFARAIEAKLKVKNGY